MNWNMNWAGMPVDLGSQDGSAESITQTSQWQAGQTERQA
jgi:hypothetical protein